MAETKLFWDIEKEKKNRIYVLFAVLLVIYFIPFYFIWLIVKTLFYVKAQGNAALAPFSWFGFDTVLVLIIAAVLTSMHWYLSQRNLVSRVTRLVNARIPDPRDQYHNVFTNIVDELATAAGGITVEPYIIPTGALNAFAVSDLQGRNVVGVTEGLLSRLSRAELQSIIAHEIAHIASNDSLLTTIACALFSIHGEAIRQINASVHKRSARYNPITGEEMPSSAAAAALMVLPLLTLIFITDALATLLNMFINREKESRADAAAVRYSRDPRSLASALYKISTHWRGAGCGGDNLAPIFILNPHYSKLEEADNFMATLFSTHPPVMRRLRVLLDMAHASLDELIALAGRPKESKTEIDTSGRELEFYVRQEGGKKGPFTVTQLQSLDYLTPDTELEFTDTGNSIKANELPALSYFFEKKDDPAWKMRRLCPDCRQWLIVRHYEGMHLLYCPFCRGIQVDLDKLPRITARQDKGFTDSVRRNARHLHEQARTIGKSFKLLIECQHHRFCPRCGKPMVHRFYSYAYHIEIDECRSCRVIWFDQHELEILQCMIETGEKTGLTPM